MLVAIGGVFGLFYAVVPFLPKTKAAWTIGVILFPFIGILVYLIARGGGMAERQMAQEKAAKADFDAYVQETAGEGATPSEQIAQAQQLLDAGTISQEEYDQLKAKALS